jgi:hypothetical protein
MRFACALLALVSVAASFAAAQPSVQLDPFAQATTGLPACPIVKPRLYTPDEMRTEAHVRCERGTRCALEGTCEPGGAFKRDAVINDQVRAAIAADQRFARTSIWITTSRKWVTLKGCVRTSAQRNALPAMVRKQPSVERVFDELTVGTRR